MASSFWNILFSANMSISSSMLVVCSWTDNDEHSVINNDVWPDPCVLPPSDLSSMLPMSRLTCILQSSIGECACIVSMKRTPMLEVKLADLGNIMRIHSIHIMLISLSSETRNHSHYKCNGRFRPRRQQTYVNDEQSAISHSTAVPDLQLAVLIGPFDSFE